VRVQPLGELPANVVDHVADRFSERFVAGRGEVRLDEQQRRRIVARVALQRAEQQVKPVAQRLRAA
jgi:hypothetical protein